MTTTTAPAYRVECHATGRDKLISNVLPATGFTTWCQRCKCVHTVAWQDLPQEVLREIAGAISGVLEQSVSREVVTRLSQ